MMLDKLHHLHHLSFAASKNNIHLVERFVEDICDYYNINNNFFGNIMTAVCEAVENAIDHGNGNNPAKKVFLKFEITPDGYSFKIKDQGHGFVPDLIPDPTDINADFSKTEGRGIYIMKSLSDVVIFHDNGSCVELVFKLASINKQLSDERINTLLSKSKTKQDTPNKK